MGEGASDVKTGETPEQLERDVQEIRVEMNGLVGELDRRRHELLDWRLQLRKHALALTIGVGGLVCVVSGLAAIAAARKHRRQRLVAKIELFRRAISRMVEHPELVARPQRGLGTAALSAAASALIGASARAIAQRANLS